MEIDYKSSIAGIRNEIQEISVPQLTDVSAARPVIIDVREPEEFAQAAIPDAHLIPRGQLEGVIGEHVADAETPIVLYCAVGERSALATLSLSRLGYRNVRSLAEGFEGWKQAGQAWVLPRVLPADQRARYSRHLLLPEVGEDGQRRLMTSKALVIGAGGLGSPAANHAPLARKTPHPREAAAPSAGARGCAENADARGTSHPGLAPTAASTSLSWRGVPVRFLGTSGVDARRCAVTAAPFCSTASTCAGAAINLPYSTRGASSCASRYANNCCLASPQLMPAA